MDNENNSNPNNDLNKADIFPSSAKTNIGNNSGEIAITTTEDCTATTHTEQNSVPSAISFSSSSTSEAVAIEVAAPMAASVPDDSPAIAAVAVDFGDPSKAEADIILDATITDDDVETDMTSATTDLVAFPLPASDNSTTIDAISIDSRKLPVDTEAIVATPSTMLGIERSSDDEVCSALGGSFENSRNSASMLVKATGAAATPVAALGSNDNAATFLDTSNRVASAGSLVATLVEADPLGAAASGIDLSANAQIEIESTGTYKDSTLQNSFAMASEEPAATTASATSVPKQAEPSEAVVVPARTVGATVNSSADTLPAATLTQTDSTTTAYMSRKRPRPDGGATPPAAQRTALTPGGADQTAGEKSTNLNVFTAEATAAEYTASLFSSPRAETKTIETLEAEANPEDSSAKAKAKIKKKKRKLGANKKRVPRKRKKGATKTAQRKKKNTKEFIRRNLDAKWKQYWTVQIAKRAIPKCASRVVKQRQAHMRRHRDLAQLCQRVIRERTRKNLRAGKDVHQRVRRLGRAIQSWWRRLDKERATQKKSRAKQKESRRRHEEEEREAKRQARKLNFLLQQTELFTHFIARKSLKGRRLTTQVHPAIHLARMHTR